MTITNTKLERWMLKWQPLLKLQDWDVIVAVQSREEMEGADGDCSHTLPRRHAVIRLAKPKRPKPDVITFYDPEQTLVHELLHLHVAPFESKKDGSPADVAQEQMIDAIATALVTLDRKNRKR